ncbi:hypothetical protein DFH08DRAFT_979126 [Mycena albidolilacea]|uniref:Uncharacterized protein n=1 Tax=Mycena albidolilacea TaxID=1033008 RepID=A0AAD7E7P1_9AGAR|nr:hypothetical protein DFH08DRAFT_979126 [Mycena albidolilacea]
MTVPLGGTGLSYAASAFLSIILESMFYGLFVFMFAISTFVLCRKRTGVRTALANVKIPVLAVSSSMFIIASMHLGIDAYSAMEGFVYFPKGAFAWLLSTGTNTPAAILKTVLYYLQTTLADGFIIYRLYKVWGDNKLICLPFVLCFFASIATGIGAITSGVLRKPTQSIFSASLHDWPLSFYVLTFVVNVGCTSLIAYRIWVVNRKAKTFNASSLFPVAVVIVESGMVYAVFVVTLLALFLSNSGAYKIVQDMLMQIIGLVFCGIIASVGLRQFESNKSTMDKSSKVSALIFGSESTATANPSRSRSYNESESPERVDVEKGQRLLAASILVPFMYMRLLTW